MSLVFSSYSSLNRRNQASRVSLGRGRGRTPPGGQRRPCPPSPLARNPSLTSNSPLPTQPQSSPFPTHPASNQQTRLSSPRGHPPSRGPGPGPGGIGRPGQRVSTIVCFNPKIYFLKICFFCLRLVNILL